VTDNGEFIRQDFSHLFEIVKNKLRDFFIKRRRVGWLGRREDRLADFCIATVQEAMLMGKVKRSRRPVEAAAREALAHQQPLTNGLHRSSRSLTRPNSSAFNKPFGPNDIVPLPSSNQRACVREPNFQQELSTLIHKNIWLQDKNV
jgi:hypothetical protein